MTDNTYRRILRRERFRSRSASVSIALGLVALGAAYVAVEWVLSFLGQRALLLSPQTAVDGVNSPSVWGVTAAGTAIALGLVVLLLALIPGRRARHTLPHDRLAIVVDDAVLASAIGRAARTEASVPADRVRTTVSARRALVAVTPSSGIAVDKPSVQAATERLAADLAPVPPLRLAVSVLPSGVVGS